VRHVDLSLILEPRAKTGSCLISFLAFFLVFLASIASAQEKQPTTYEGFEGRQVGTVDLAADPTMEVERFRPLLKQKPGQPFSIAAVRESVEALQNTKEFSQVQVRIQPQQTGLRVLFILQPAYYVGMIFFPGVGSAFPYTRLLQTVNISDQTPFADNLVTQGKNELQHLFEVEGYFAATVSPETQRDDAHRLVNITYRCNLHDRAKIGEVHIQGANPQDSAEVTHALQSFWARAKRASLKRGQRYSQTRIQKSVEFLRAHLQKRGHLTPTVRLVSSDYEPDTKRADVTLEVIPGPIVKVQVQGAHIWKRTMKKLIPIYEEGAVDKELVAEGERNLRSHFQSKGFFDVKVTSRLDRQDDRVNVLYQVQRGDRHKVEGVHFDGNKYFSDADLRSHVPLKKARLIIYHGKYSDELVKKSMASLTSMYKQAGFAEVKIEPNIEDHEPQIDVTFKITEGDQDKVKSLKIVDGRGEAVKPPTDEASLNLQPGKPYSAPLLEQDRNRIVAEYLNHGFLNAHFESGVARDPANSHRIDVVYTIEPGRQARVNQIALLGAQHTKPKFIRSITDPTVKENQPLSEGQFLNAETDLYNLGIFDWTSIGPLRPVEGQDREEVVIKVHESKRNTLDVGGGLEVIPRSGNIPVGAVALPGLPAISLGSKFRTSQKSFFGPRFTMSFARHDLRGRAETGTIGFVVSRLDQRGSLTYADPRLHGSSWSSLFSLSAERTTENSIYTAELGQASLQIEKYLDRKHTRTVRARYSFQRTFLSNISIPQLVLPEDQKVRLSTVSAEYIRDTRDNALDAHHGLYQTMTFGVTPTALGSSSNFVRFLGQTAFYLPVEPWLTWANNFRVGFAPPFSGSRVPLSERFFSGGADSLRGFPMNGAGPQRPVTVCSNPGDASTCSVISVPVGGEMLAIVNSEARFPIPLKSGLGGVVFYDGGNIYSNINFHQFVDHYSNSIGFGIRYHTPVGPIRIDIGRNLNPVPGVKATQYFVTLGQAF
jgi:outer membrane protein insertion porin family